MRRIPASWPRGVGMTTLTLALFTGCASHSEPPVDEARVRQFSGKGYLAEERYGVTTSFSTLATPAGSFDVALTLPTKAGPFPLVVYQPSLGETRSAGESWRTAWAEAGYAVIAYQPLAPDAADWSPGRGRTGDFTAAARDRYAAPIVARRTEALRAVLDALHGRADGGDESARRIDLSRVAVAGFDLGAYTAMVAAGETLRNAAVPALPGVRAAIALSPHADFSGPAFGERYGQVRGAVLAVTSDDDSDALGVVTSPAIRRAPFEYMPAGDKYLLRLGGIPHRTFSGSPGPDPDAPTDALPDHVSAAVPQDANPGGGKRRGGGLGRENVRIAGPRSSPTERAIGVRAVQTVTVAFLDAQLKDDPVAREWLARDAGRWLGDHGRIELK